MGAIQSLNASQTVALFFIGGVAVYWYTQFNTAETTQQTPDKTAQRATQGGKQLKKKASEALNAFAESIDATSTPKPKPGVVSFPAVVPGAFDPAGDDTTSEPMPMKASKSKKKKSKGKKTVGNVVTEVAVADTQSESSFGGEPAPQVATPPSSGPSSSSRTALKPASKLPPSGEEEAWTRVSRRKALVGSTPTGNADPAPSSADHNASDAGVTTSATTGNSSPTTEKTEDEVLPAVVPGQPRTLAEKLTPKPPKTGVEDMLETPDVPTLARVLRVHPPRGEKPHVGFSWGDYEDVHVSDMGGADADGEDDDGGWGVVKSKGRSKQNRAVDTSTSGATSTYASTPQKPTKKQRQNAARREAENATKASIEKERLAAFAVHKHGLEQDRTKEQQKLKKTVSSSGTTGNNIPSTPSGSLVWD